MVEGELLLLGWTILSRLCSIQCCTHYISLGWCIDSHARKVSQEDNCSAGLQAGLWHCCHSRQWCFNKADLSVDCCSQYGKQVRRLVSGTGEGQSSIKAYVRGTTGLPAESVAAKQNHHWIERNLDGYCDWATTTEVVNKAMQNFAEGKG